MRKLLRCAGVAAVAVSIVSCGSSEQLEDTAAAAQQVENAFADAPPAAQKAAQVANEAILNGQYEKAVVSIQAMEMNPNLTMAQYQAAKNMRIATRQRIAEAMMSGDPNAIKAAEMLRRMAPQ